MKTKWYRKNQWICLLGIWLGFLVTLPIMRYIAIPPFGWWFVIKMCAGMAAVCSVPMWLLGWSTQRQNERNQKRWEEEKKARELYASLVKHEPLLELDGKKINGLKRCAHCGLSEIYWSRWPICPAIAVDKRQPQCQ